MSGERLIILNYCLSSTHLPLLHTKNSYFVRGANPPQIFPS